MNDALDAIMQVMQEAFDSRFGEAWTRAQVADSMIMPNVHHSIIRADGGFIEDSSNDDDEFIIELAAIGGFTLSRQAADEEELLLIAVCPAFRNKGLGNKLLQQLIASARSRGVARLFLEMRDGNPAEHLYLCCDFEKIGVRKGYYRGAAGGPLDAITFALQLN